MSRYRYGNNSLSDWSYLLVTCDSGQLQDDGHILACVLDVIELRLVTENRFEFPRKLIVEANHIWRVLKLGAQNDDFGPVFADILNQMFSSVCGNARHVLVNGYFYHQSSWVSWKCGQASKTEAFALLNLKRSSLGLFNGQENRREKKVMAQSIPSVPITPPPLPSPSPWAYLSGICHLVGLGHNQSINQSINQSTLFKDGKWLSKLVFRHAV